MPARSSCGVVYVVVLAACTAGTNRIDPGDLELRDLLGISPEIASAWDDAQRAAARRVLEIGLGEIDAPSQRALTPEPGGLDERVAEHLHKIGSLAIDGWKRAAAQAGLTLHTGDLPSLAHFRFDHPDEPVLTTLFTQ